MTPAERLTKRPEDVTCATCRGYLPIVAPHSEAPRGPEPVAWRCQHGHYASKQQDGDGVCTWQPLYATPPEAVGEACRKCRGAGYLLADTPGVKYLRLTCDACHGTGKAGGEGAR